MASFAQVPEVVYGNSGAIVTHFDLVQIVGRERNSIEAVSVALIQLCTLGDSIEELESTGGIEQDIRNKVLSIVWK